MPKVSPIQDDFSSGELSPFMSGRVSTPRYKMGLDTCLNYISTIQGPVTRRPGTRFIHEVKDSNSYTRLIRFTFSNVQDYMLEFGNNYVRFYTSDALILSGPPYEVVTPYLTADLAQIRFCQSADVLYLVHPKYPPAKLNRLGNTNWTYTPINFIDGPYLNINLTPTTLTPSATGPGAGILINASNTTNINGGSGFLPSDVGREIRIFQAVIAPSGVWGWCTITSVTNPQNVVVTVPVSSSLTSVAAKLIWRLGLWSQTTGYPSTVTFHEDRLVFGATIPTDPQRIDASNVGTADGYETFSPTDGDGTVTDARSYSFVLNSDDVNTLFWMKSAKNALIAGTAANEWLMRPSSLGEAMTPINVTAKPSTSYGSANIEPVRMGNMLFFIQRSGRKGRELHYDFSYNVDALVATDLTILSDHISQSGFKQLVFQKDPHPIVWAIRNDGVLVGMSYERDLDSLKIGWHRHIFGGFSDLSGNPSIIESIEIIPDPTGTRDELWFIVKRIINGVTKRYVEVMSAFFQDTDEQRDAFFVDCGLSYDDPKAITALSLGVNITVTAAAHGFSNGDEILIDSIFGTTQLNTNSYFVGDSLANSFTLKDAFGAYIDGSAFTLYAAGGEARKYVSTISGLAHLEGQTVQVLADGGATPDVVVTAGAITLAVPATTVQVGLGYKSQGRMLRIEAGAADGTASGKVRRAHRIGINFYRSLGLDIGYNDFNSLKPVTLSSVFTPLNRAPPLFTGILKFTTDGDNDFNNQFCFQQAQPLPSTILAVMPQMYTEDAG